jgi:hypothetical protein
MPQVPMTLAGAQFDGLTSLAATCHGGWSLGRTRDWCGMATCGEPLVGMAFLHAGGITEWCKSERGDEHGLKLRLALFPYDVGLEDVQVNFSVARGGCRWRCTVQSSQYIPAIPERREVRTGVIEVFATIEGDPAIEVCVLLIARRDVKSARNGLWRLRRNLASSVPEPYGRILTYGRTGTIAA